MKKLLILTLGIGFCNFASAGSSIDLSTTNISCNNYKITMTSTPTDITKNCNKLIKFESQTEFLSKTTEQEIKFTSDDGSTIKCKFNDSKLNKCKID